MRLSTVDPWQRERAEVWLACFRWYDKHRTWGLSDDAVPKAIRHAQATGFRDVRDLETLRAACHEMLSRPPAPPPSH